MPMLAREEYNRELSTPKGKVGLQGKGEREGAMPLAAD